MGSSTPISTPSATVAEIRGRKQAQRIQGLRAHAQRLLEQYPGCSLWLFGSLARGDWDAFSDVDVLAVAPERPLALDLAERVLSQGLADDALPLTLDEWAQRQTEGDLYWSAIAKDALCLAKA